MSNKKLFYIIFFVVFAANILNTNIVAWDSRWTIHTAYSLIYERNLDLDEYSTVIQKNENYGIWKGSEHVYNYFPIGVSIIALPFVFAGEYVFELALIINPDLKTSLQQKGFTLINVTNYYYIVEYFIASIIVALCACLMFFIARRYINTGQALLLTFVFAFCTSLWSVAGRALWMHGPLILALLYAIYLLTKEELKTSNIVTLGCILAFTFIIRPTGLIFFAGILFYLFTLNKKFALTYLSSGFVIFLGFFFLNYSIYGTVLSPYYQFYFNLLSGSGFPNLGEAFLGNLISPGKGLLIFTPVILFSFLGLYLKIKAKEFSKFDLSLILIFIVYFLAVSLVKKWWDGWSYGPRYISDVLPILMYFLIFFFRYFSTLKYKRAVSFIFVLLTLISLYIHTKGALSYRVWVEWNGKPNDVDTHPERVWDWKDPPFLR